MSKTALDLEDLSRIGLSVGMDLGFNACEVQKILDPETLEPWFNFIWFDRCDFDRLMRRQMEYYCSYSCEVECTREPRTMVLREPALEKSADWLRGRCTEALLELAP